MSLRPCDNCINGRIYNNADETSGQSHQCPLCDGTSEVECLHECSENGVCNECAAEVNWKEAVFA